MDLFKKNYGIVNKKVIAKAKKIKLLVSDVDGVISNGLIYINDDFKELKTFNVKDNYGIRCLLKSNINFAIISGRKSDAVKFHCQSLGIKYIYQGKLDKIISLNELIQKLSLSYLEIAYVGDDLIDLPILYRVGLSITTADSHPILLNSNFDYITKCKGGKGAIREICDLILYSQNKLDYIKKYF